METAKRFNSLEKGLVNGTLNNRYVRVSKLGCLIQYNDGVRDRRPGFDSVAVAPIIV